MKKTLISLAAAGLAAVSLPASALGVFQEFTVDETVVAGTDIFNLANPALVADKLNGSYTEALTVTGPNTFSAQAFGYFSEYLANDGTTPVPGLLSNLEGIGGYQIYAVFSASGTITGPNQFTSSNNAFNLYLDQSSNTTATLSDGTTAPVLLDTGDDILLASAGPNQTLGTGNLNGPPGAFNIDWYGFALTAFGETFFTDPEPFYMHVRVNGDYDIIRPGDQVGTRIITGDVSAVFPIPEPGSLALLGLALAGVGLSSYRRKQSL